MFRKLSVLDDLNLTSAANVNFIPTPFIANVNFTPTPFILFLTNPERLMLNDINKLVVFRSSQNMQYLKRLMPRDRCLDPNHQWHANQRASHWYLYRRE
jgi:hypothetical protein